MINNRQNGRRRGRGGTQVRGPGNGPDRGNRIDNRARGNAAQLHEKYRNLARDAQTQGDRVMTEYYLQFADHYFRVLNENRSRFEDQNQPRRPRFENDEFEGEAGDEGENGDEMGDMDPRGIDPRRDDREPRRQDRDVRSDREPRQDRDARQDREQRQDRETRPDREPRRRDREPVAVEAEAPREEGSEEDAGEARRGRRGRRPRRAEGEAQGDEASPRIEIDRLPPAFAPVDEPSNGHAPAAAETGTTDEAPAESAPRRRRTRRVAGTEDSTVAA